MTELSEALDRLMELDQESYFALLGLAKERMRQITVEGWSTEHDDKHTECELSTAAACYALAHLPRGFKLTKAAMRSPTIRHREENDARRVPPHSWPWSGEWWKPKSPHRNLVRAGALILAELARIQRIGLD